MIKKNEKMKQENDLLLTICKKEPKHVQLIHDLLALQKTKTLMIKKRGFQTDIENLIEQFINKSKQLD